LENGQFVQVSSQRKETTERSLVVVVSFL
jgi:hypothetical protein